MINPQLHANPVPLDLQQHRALKLQLPIKDWSFSHKLNAMFVAAAEFTDVCKEYAIVFVRAGQDAVGKPEIAPIAVLGLTQGRNLYLAAGGAWRANYVPAVLRFYPFCIGRLDEQRYAVCVDMAWPGAASATGEPVFKADGSHSELLTEVQKNMELLEGEIERTRLVGHRLVELDLLRDMRFDATLPDGRKQSVDGFLTVDETKLQALPDAAIGELHRQGVLGLVHLHWTSMANMRRLVEWHAQPAS
jgi:hypothetical protein